jgi:hypothetical protein
VFLALKPVNTMWSAQPYITVLTGAAEGLPAGIAAHHRLPVLNHLASGGTRSRIMESRE